MRDSMHLHQAVSVEGGWEFLRELESAGASAHTPEEIAVLMQRAGILDPDATLNDFLASGLLTRFGERIGLSNLGSRTLLLLEALNGSDLREIYRKLGQYDASLNMYELVREGMTSNFLENINSRPGFSRLYFCSPWIGLAEKQQALLAHAIFQAERRGERPELLVITRPSDASGGGPTSTKPFRDLGATIFLNSRLHSKLYIREPTSAGGYSMAIIGSQNLTRSNYLELGIRVNSDGVMINQLIGYFWELCNDSVES